MTRSDVVRRTVAVALMCLTGSAIFIRLFGPIPVLTRIWPVIALCCVGYAVGTAGGPRVQRGLGALAAVVTTVIGSLALGAMTIADRDGTIALSNFFAGVVEGLGIILTSVVPAPVSAETITAGILITGYAALVGCLLVTTFLPASSVVPAAGIFLGGLMLSQGSALSALPFAAVFVAGVVVALSMMPASKQQNVIQDGAEFAEVEKVPKPGGALRVALVGLTALGVALGAMAIAPVTGVGSVRAPFDPHRKDNFRPDTNLDGDDVVSLATKWQTLLRQNRIDLFTVTGPDIPDAVNWAVNAKFDGVAWSSLTSFDLVEGDIPAPAPPPQRRTVEGSTGFETGPQLPGPWLPSTFRPTGVTGTTARVDEEGTLVAGDERGADKRYDVAFRSLALRSLAPLQTVAPVDHPEFGTLREVPRDFPEQLRLFAASAMATGATPYEKVQALASTLSTTPYEEQVDSIDNGLDSASLLDVVIGGRRGTQAQFATAFALMARTQGYPTRLVVGYAIPGQGSVRSINSTDVIIYPEVQFTKIGWIPFAPGPQDLTRGVPVVKVVKAPKPPKPTPTPSATPSPSPSPPAPPAPPPSDSGMSGVVLAVLGLLLAAACWPLLVRWRLARVRSRLRTGAPEEQVTGAWTYVRGAASRLGRPLDASVSPASYATDPDPALSTLARWVEAAMYAPEQIPDIAAHQAWAQADKVVAGTVRDAAWTRRLRWWLVPWVGRT